MRWNVKLPSLGEWLNEVQVASVNVKPGDIIKEDYIYMTLSVDKADIEIPVPFSCKVKSVKVRAGDMVRIGGTLLTVEVDPKENIGIKENIANIKAGFHWISSKKSEQLCPGDKRGKYSFGEFLQRIDNAILLAKRFKELPIHRLPSWILDGIRAAQFEITLVIGRLERFHYSRTDVKDAGYLRVMGFVRKNLPGAIRNFFHSYYLACEWLDVEEFPGELNLEGAREQVFLVHGHDAKMAKLVAEFLESLGLEPVILSEREGKGDTIIEKLERYSSVRYAIVILTPDDVGRSVSSHSKAMPRARQNVIFELGYFVGKLGRSRVSALYDEAVELPSDFRGVEYIRLDLYSEWKPKLENELRAVELDIKPRRKKK